MTQSELQIAQGHIGCTNAQLARWLETTPLAVTRWRTGKTKIPGPAAVAIRALVSGWRP